VQQEHGQVPWYLREAEQPWFDSIELDGIKTKPD
jgi:hypothetical protein